MKRSRKKIIFFLCCLLLLVGLSIGAYFNANIEVFSKEVSISAVSDMPAPLGVLEKPIFLDYMGELMLDQGNINKEDILSSDEPAEMYYSLHEKNKGLIYIRINNVKESTLRIVLAPIGNESLQPDEIRGVSEGYYPLTHGAGEYMLRIFAVQVDGTYTQVFSDNFVAEFETNEPYKYTNVFSMYSANSVAIKKAYALTKSDSSNEEKAIKIKKYIDNNISYDYEKEEAVLELIKNNNISLFSSEFVDIDYIYNEERGICSDFAALFSVMMKSVGVPTREVRGYTWASGSKYHSWNEYLDDFGEWVTIETGSKILNNRYYRDAYSER